MSLYPDTPREYPSPLAETGIAVLLSTKSAKIQGGMSGVLKAGKEEREIVSHSSDVTFPRALSLTLQSNILIFFPHPHP